MEGLQESSKLLNHPAFPCSSCLWGCFVLSYTWTHLTGKGKQQDNKTIECNADQMHLTHKRQPTHDEDNRERERECKGDRERESKGYREQRRESKGEIERERESKGERGREQRRESKGERATERKREREREREMRERERGERKKRPGLLKSPSKSVSEHERRGDHELPIGWARSTSTRPPLTSVASAHLRHRCQRLPPATSSWQEPDSKGPKIFRSHPICAGVRKLLVVSKRTGFLQMFPCTDIFPPKSLSLLCYLGRGKL